MSTSERYESLDGDLHRLASQAAGRTRETDLVARALELAVATGADDRAWALTRLAADLRSLGRSEEALRVLDTAYGLAPSFDAERAIFTVAIAVHCDQGRFETAVALERQQAARSIDVKFARACARLYAELFAESDDEEHRARRDAYVAAIESLQADGPIAAVPAPGDA